MEKIEIEEEEIREPIPGEYGHPIPRELLFRELGFTLPYSRHQVGRRVVSTTLATKAVHTLCTKPTVNRRKFKLPAGARTTFHMAFSADGTKLASCHGDHNVYVCDVRNGEVLQTLSGHPRTPWCVVFHPTQNDVLASGCLAGHVRVWDLKGGSEVLITDSGTVIASLAFHPTVRLLAIATFNEIIFWDWGLPNPLARCSTENTKEKVRLVRFDRLGKSLITGITNFPSPPVREGLQTSSAGSNHRPNILSRGNSRLPTYGFFIHDRPDISDSREGPVEVGESPDSRSGGASANGDMGEFAESFAAAAEAEAASMVLNRRQDRFQESYRQLVSHYQDLVSHYQQFLRSRIPRLLETSRIVREQPILSVQNPILQTESEASTSTQARAQSEAPAASTSSEQPGTSRLMQLEARLLEIINTPENPEQSSVNQGSSTTNASASSTGQGSSTSSIPQRLRNDTDLRNIEVLAQNILEMQNLCSQARRDAPVTHIETQHIIELQNIRSHLELLQEQTRELQSSIRATLTSLARGSLDALRTHVTNASNSASFSNFSRGTLDALRSQAGGSGSSYPGFFSIPSSSQSTTASNQGMPRSYTGASSSQQAAGSPSNAILRITIGPRLTASAELIPPVTSSGHSSTSTSGGATRTQVPPAITMQYEIPSGGFRAGSGEDNGEAHPSTSRGNGRSSADGNAFLGQRRILREFQFVTGRGSNEMEQHARNCPFGGRDQAQRPPGRMRCLSEMGETPTLTVWPTVDTGLELETRNFRAVREPRSRPEPRASGTGSSNSNNSTAAEPRVATEPSIANPAALHVSSSLHLGNYFSQWYAGGPSWISSDVGVHVFLTTRRANDGARRALRGPIEEETDGGEEGENWQRLFPHGFAFIHPSARQGHRPDRRPYRRDTRRPGSSSSGRLRGDTASCPRESAWNELMRTNPNFQPLPAAPSSASALSSMPGPSTSMGAPSSRNPGRPLPQRLSGNFGLVYFMRIGDEIIPVYAPRSELSDSNDPVALREGPLANVYVFPIGLFLRGSSWKNGTQTVGIYWPPNSRDEEQALSDYRRSDSVVPIYTTPVRRSAAIQRSERVNSARYRVVYNSDQTEIVFPEGGSLVFIQPGLLILDAVTTFADFDRPRAEQGTMYLDFLAPFLDAVETLFGFRQRHQVSPSSSGANPSPTRASSQANWSRAPGIPHQWLNNPPFSQAPRIYYDVPDRPEVNSVLGRRHPSDPSYVPMIPAEARVTLERIDRPTIERVRRGLRDEEPSRTAHTTTTTSAGSEGNPINRSDRWTGTGTVRPEAPPSDSHIDAMNPSRRVIRLAVDTATADILRRDQQGARGHITRAIESRIERVLNERGNRGVPDMPHSVMYLPMPAVNIYNNTDSTQERQLRLEDVQLRISMLSPWSQQSRTPSESVTSATQTTASFLQNTSPSNSEQVNATTSATPSLSPPNTLEPTPSTSTGGPTSVDPLVRAARRRPFPCEALSSNSATSVPASLFEDDSSPSPSRIPRLATPLAQAIEVSVDPTSDGRNRPDWNQAPSNYADGSTARSSGLESLRDITPEDEPNSLTTRPANPLLQTMNAEGSADSSDSASSSSAVNVTLRPPYLSPESAEEALRGSLTLTEEERVSDLNEFWRNSGRYEHTITQEEREPEVARERTLSEYQSNPRRLGSTDEYAAGRSPSEPLMLRLRDVLTPVEVSRIDGARHSLIPRVDLDSPDSDDVEVEREAHLVVGSAVPFESPEALTTTNDNDDWERGAPGARPSGRGAMDRNRLSNPVLQRVGEDTARAAIAAMEMMRREPAVPSGDISPSAEEAGSYDLLSEQIGLPNIEINRRRGGSSVGVEADSEREMSSRERRRARPVTRLSSGGSILRNMEETNVRLSGNYTSSSLSSGGNSTDGQGGNTQLSNPQEDSNSSGSSAQRQGPPSRSRLPMSTQFGEWLLRRQQRSASQQYRVRLRNGESGYSNGGSSGSNVGPQELSGSARTRLGLGTGSSGSASRYSSASTRGSGLTGSGSHSSSGQRHGSSNSSHIPSTHAHMYRNPQHHFHIHHAMAGNPTNNGDDPGIPQDSGVRFYPGYIPEILITPRTRAQTYYTMDAASTAFLSSRIQKWDFSEFYIPDITDRTSGLITASCSLHSDATLDVSSDSEFIAVLQPSDNGSYSAVGIYSLRDETLGASLYTYHFDQNTVSVSISPSCDYIVVGYAGRGPFYRIVHPSRNIGQILSLTRERDHVKLVPVKELLADTQPTLMSINCMHWVPIPGYGIIYGTNTGEVVLLS